MANKNPLAGAFISKTEMPHAAPHSKHLRHPDQKAQVRHKGRPIVEMPRGHGARMSAAGRDMHVSSNKSPKLPGMKEPSGIQRVGVPGSRNGHMKTMGKMSTPHRGPMSAR